MRYWGYSTGMHLLMRTAFRAQNCDPKAEGSFKMSGAHGVGFSPLRVYRGAARTTTCSCSCCSCCCSCSCSCPQPIRGDLVEATCTTKEFHVRDALPPPS